MQEYDEDLCEGEKTHEVVTVLLTRVCCRQHLIHACSKVILLTFLCILVILFDNPWYREQKGLKRKFKATLS